MGKSIGNSSHVTGASLSSLRELLRNCSEIAQGALSEAHPKAHLSSPSRTRPEQGEYKVTNSSRKLASPFYNTLQKSRYSIYVLGEWRGVLETRQTCQVQVAWRIFTVRISSHRLDAQSIVYLIKAECMQQHILQPSCCCTQ
jgi:hypothetical protein